MQDGEIQLLLSRQISEVKKLIELWLGKEVAQEINIFHYEGRLLAITDYFVYLKSAGRQSEHINKVQKLIRLYFKSKFSFEQLLEGINDKTIDSIIELLFKKKGIV